MVARKPQMLTLPHQRTFTGICRIAAKPVKKHRGYMAKLLATARLGGDKCKLVASVTSIKYALNELVQMHPNLGKVLDVKKRRRVHEILRWLVLQTRLPEEQRNYKKVNELSDEIEAIFGKHYDEFMNVWHKKQEWMVFRMMLDAPSDALGVD